MKEDGMFEETKLVSHLVTMKVISLLGPVKDQETREIIEEMERKHRKEIETIRSQIGEIQVVDDGRP